MLKLERTSHDQDISITFRTKERFLTHPLLISMAIAMAIHLGFLLFFHITPLKIHWGNHPSPPVLVEAELGPSDENLVLADISLNVMPDNILLKAPPSLPFLSNDFLYTRSHSIAHFYTSEGSVDLFQEIEQEIFFPSFSLTKITSNQPISVNIFGPLASKKFEDHNVTNFSTKLFSDLNINIIRPHHFCYSVLVNEQTGKVFWHVLLEPGDNSSLEKIATAMIYDLQFTRTPAAFVTAGQIELHINPGHSSYD